jgi:hypothetical protein
MKKLLLILICIILTGMISAQKPFVFFGRIPSNLFAEEMTGKTIKPSGIFLWSLDAVVSGAEITFNKETNVFETSFLSGVGGAIGYKNYKLLSDGTTIISNWGLSLAILTKVKLNDVTNTRMKLALLANLYNITAGPVYTFGDNRVGLLIGATINF